jgi:hypothetical protein
VLLQGKRYKILMGAAFLEGASFGTLIEQVLDFDPRYVLLKRKRSNCCEMKLWKWVFGKLKPVL